jgi:hypothetical protein
MSLFASATRNFTSPNNPEHLLHIAGSFRPLLVGVLCGGWPSIEGQPFLLRQTQYQQQTNQKTDQRNRTKKRHHCATQSMQSKAFGVDDNHGWRYNRSSSNKTPTKDNQMTNAIHHFNGVNYCENEDCCPVHQTDVKKVYDYGMGDAEVITFHGCRCALTVDCERGWCIGAELKELGIDSCGTAYYDSFNHAAAKANMIKMHNAAR